MATFCDDLDDDGDVTKVLDNLIQSQTTQFLCMQKFLQVMYRTRGITSVAPELEIGKIPVEREKGPSEPMRLTAPDRVAVDSYSRHLGSISSGPMDAETPIPKKKELYKSPIFAPEKSSSPGVNTERKVTSRKTHDLSLNPETLPDRPSGLDTLSSQQREWSPGGATVATRGTRSGVEKGVPEVTGDRTGITGTVGPRTPGTAEGRMVKDEVTDNEVVFNVMDWGQEGFENWMSDRGYRGPDNNDEGRGTNMVEPGCTAGTEGGEQGGLETNLFRMETNPICLVSDDWLGMEALSVGTDQLGGRSVLRNRHDREQDVRSSRVASALPKPSVNPAASSGSTLFSGPDRSNALTPQTQGTMQMKVMPSSAHSSSVRLATHCQPTPSFAQKPELSSSVNQSRTRFPPPPLKWEPVQEPLMSFTDHLKPTACGHCPCPIATYRQNTDPTILNAIPASTDDTGTVADARCCSDVNAVRNAVKMGNCEKIDQSNLSCLPQASGTSNVKTGKSATASATPRPKQMKVVPSDDEVKPAQELLGSTSTPISLRKNRQMIKLGTYGGTTAVEAFIRKFEICAKNNEWDDDEKSNQLMCALVEPANQILWDYDSSSVVTWSDLLKKLRSRYGGNDQAALYQTQLNTRKQKSGEDLGMLVQDIRRLMALAFPGPTSNHSEMIAIRSFLDALADKELALKLREREPETLDQAYKMASRLEGYKKADSDVLELPERRPARVKAIKEEEPSLEEFQKIVQQQLEPHQRRLERIEQLLDERKTVGTGGNNVASTAAGTNRVQRKPSSFDRTRKARKSRKYNPERSKKRCFACGQLGHYVKTCPQNLSSPFRPREEEDTAEQATLHQVKGSNTAYLSLRVNGKPTLALVDTGSELSIAPASLVQSKDITGSEQLLRAANGTAIQVRGEVVLQCQAEGYRFEVPCLVSEQISELILGLSWLEQQDVQWNLGQRTMRINGHFLPVCSKRPESSCRRIAVSSDVTVPARSELDVEAHAVVPNLKMNFSQWATQPQILVSGLMVAGTLLPKRNTDLVVRVMNPTDRDIRMRKGSQCIIDEVDVVEADVNKKTAGCSVVTEENHHTESIDVEAVLSPLWEEADAEIPPDVREKLRQLVLGHRNAFSVSEWDLGFTNIIQHEIKTGSEQPVRQPLRRQPMTLLPVIDAQVDQMLKHRLIEPANSAWSSNVVMVTKKDGTPRFCIDYRAVNAKTRKDSFPLPLISESIDTLAGGKWFSTFDLRAGYFQVAVHPRDRHKTAFITRKGSYQFRVLPFGLCNSPSSFSRMMNLVMSGLNYVSCLVYLDDIIVFAANLDDHLARLAQVLARLSQAGLKLKPSKCHLLKREVLFLGHIISAEGVSTDPSKVQAVTEWPTPLCLRDVRSFVGLCSYYRKFIPRFATVAKPLHALTRKGQPFKWSEDCERAFNELKRLLTIAPILALPNDNDQYVLDTDASGDAIGAVLSQVQEGKEKVICYGSRLCSTAERNYDVTKRELLAIVFFLKFYRQYLLGRNFVLRTDHAALQWLRRTPVPIGQQARWLSIVEEFQLQIHHRGGLVHGNADAMSRRPYSIDAITSVPAAASLDSTLPSEWSRAVIFSEQRADPDLGWIIAQKEASLEVPSYDLARSRSGIVKNLLAQWPQLELRNGLLTRSWLDPQTNN